ncbi:MAG: hypothetical protein HQ567_12365 [Candidatus Nealsonbacteria bacterium]|nr:hypothetical protein [Candidatus Nealsonbacteria bacterium]
MEELTLDALIAAIKSDDPERRTKAMLAAGSVGAAGIRPLAKLVATGELEVARAATRAMWKIVRTVGAPGFDAAKKSAVVSALTGLLVDATQPAAVLREVIWMLSEIGGDETIAAMGEIPGLLENKEIREDARCAAERIPGAVAVDGLKEALEAAPADFRNAIAQSLRVRGVKVSEKTYPNEKLVPTKQTEVKPVAP